MPYALEQICERHDAAALIVEPLVLGAGGMRMYPPWFVERRLLRHLDWRHR
jgi:adenosylmethionine-8-amino-7-oxononanoate aminotransferase